MPSKNSSGRRRLSSRVSSGDESSAEDERDAAEAGEGRDGAASHGVDAGATAVGGVCSDGGGAGAMRQLLGGVRLILHSPSKQPSRRRLYLTRDGSQINISALSGMSTERLRPADVRECVEEGNAAVDFAQSRAVPRDASRCLTLGGANKRVHLECSSQDERDRVVRGIRAWLASRLEAS